MSNPRRPAEQKGHPRKNKGEKTAEVHRIKEELRQYAHSKWGRAWVNSILKYGRPYRMRRALAYAQEERISNLIISPGKIFSTVQGTAPTPYRVTIHFDTIPDEDWNKILQEISEKTIYIIQLLENRMPDDFIAIFKDHGHSLFPIASRQLDASCSCPDKEIPCKHIASTILYIARVVDFNPFILLKIKGMERDKFLGELKKLRTLDSELFKEMDLKKRGKKKGKDLRKKDFSVPILPAHDLKHSLKNFKEGDPIKIGFQIKTPRKHIETLDSLGSPDNLESPETFDLLFRNIYYKVVKKTYSMALELEKKQG